VVYIILSNKQEKCKRKEIQGRKKNNVNIDRKSKKDEEKARKRVRE
jgi:hypothetical protein